jgi:hypothetical protein
MQTWDSSVSAIIYGAGVEQAQRQFEEWCSQKPEGDEEAEILVKRIIAAQLVDQLITESGGKAMQWPEISQRLLDPAAVTAVDESEQGLWLDVNQVAVGGRFNGDVEALKRGLPDEICSGLNWSPAKQCIFLVTVLSPPPPPPDPEAEFEQPEAGPVEDMEGEEATDDLDEFVASLPEMRQKETAALVEARNALLAGYLWRKFAADTAVASNEIHVGQCCTVFCADAQGDEGGRTE